MSVFDFFKLMAWLQNGQAEFKKSLSTLMGKLDWVCLKKINSVACTLFFSGSDLHADLVWDMDAYNCLG